MKFELSKVKGKHVMWAIALFVFFVYLQQGIQPETQAAVDVCAEDDYTCKVKEGMKPVWDYILDHMGWTLGIIAGLTMLIYFMETR